MSPIDRRSVLKRAAVIGVAGWTAPLIISSAADAISVGTPKCIPRVSLSAAAGFKANNNGACGVGMIVNYVATSGPICACTGATQTQYVRWDNGTAGAALYTSFTDTGSGAQALPFVTVGSNVTNEVLLWAPPATGSSAPRSLAAGSYTVTACEIVKCCRTIGGVQHSSYVIQQSRFTITVGAPCSTATISVAISQTTTTPLSACPGSIPLVACP
jgi:hypothetical protein